MNLQSLGLAGVSLIGYEQVTGMTVKKSLTVPAAATGAILRATGQNVRVRFDGTDPTATVGMQITKDLDCVIHSRADLVAMEVIQETATAVLNVQYFTRNP